MRAPLPVNEVARLAALREYRLLDTEPERAYDDITAVASLLCGTPISLVVLLDADRQWFKSRHGLGASETPREFAFCAHAVLAGATLVVEDARTDLRFAENPLVLSDPHIRFYAGAPLLNPEGLALGTLCVIDSNPRPLPAAQQAALEALARQVVALMELRRVAAELAAALDGERALRDMLPSCSWCRRVRDDDGYWKQVEDYLRRYDGTHVTHGICQDCSEKVAAEAGP